MSNEDIAVLIQDGETELLPLLWDRLERLIKSKARRYYFSHEKRCRQAGAMLDDLYQEGYFALVDTVAAFEPYRGLKLTTYLNYPIKNRYDKLIGIRRKAADVVSLDTVTGDGITLADAMESKTAAAQLEGVERMDYLRRLHTDLDAALAELDAETSAAIRKKYYRDERTDAEEKKVIYDGIRRIRRSKALKSYRDEWIAAFAFRRGSEWLSSTEFTALKLIERRQ